MVPGTPQTLRTLFMVTVVITVASVAGDKHATATCDIYYMSGIVPSVWYVLWAHPILPLRHLTRVSLSGLCGM